MKSGINTTKTFKITLKKHDTNVVICNNPTLIEDSSPTNERIAIEEVEQQINKIKNKKPMDLTVF